ncbi:MAG: hypothetical protein ABIU05_05485 [Nitrospirales bacterium]
MPANEFPDLLKLTGEEWLRLLTSELNVTALAGWCTPCRAAELNGTHCSLCQKPIVQFNTAFWHNVGEKIRRVLAKNRTLLPEVKAAWKALYGDRRQPTFPAELEWLTPGWIDAGNPPHRPFNPKVQYDVANWVRRLQARGLSQEEIIDVMDGTFDEDTREGPITLGKKNYANIPVQDLRALRQQFKEVMGYVPGSLLNREELYRTLEWVDHQRANPMARLRGEGVRKKSAEHGPDGQNPEKPR